MQKRFFEGLFLGLVLLFAGCGGGSDRYEGGDRFGRGGFDRNDGDSDERDDDDSDSDADLPPGNVAPEPGADDGDGDADDGELPGAGDPEGNDGDDDAPAPYPGTPGDEDSEDGNNDDDADEDQEPLPTPVPAEGCDGVPAEGLCEFDIMITCENNRRVEQQCDTICGQVDGQLACLSDTAMIIEFEAPTFVCQGQAGPFVMIMAGGEVISYDQNEVEVAGTYEYLAGGMRFDIPGRFVGDTAGELVEAMMLLGFHINDDLWCDGYGYDPVQSFDAYYDCGATDSIGGYGIASKAFELTRPGHVVLYSTIDSAYGTSTNVYEGVYRMEGDTIIMATIQGNMTVSYYATRGDGGMRLGNGTWCGAQ